MPDSSSKAELAISVWKEAGSQYPCDVTIHQLFREQVLRSPKATAVAYRDRIITYEELDRRSDRLAEQLRSRGVKPEQVVAVCLPRSPEQIIALLAILKTGAAYLPLDSGNPASRNAFIVRDASVQILVTDPERQAALSLTGFETLLLDEATASPDEREEIEPAPAGTGRSLAYVITTSGSTGEPKGVMVEHRSIARLVFGQTYARFGPDRVFLQLAPVAFDASTFEIWGALLHGSKLVIVPEGPLDPAIVGDLIQGHGVTTLWLTAGLFNEVVDTRPEILRGVSEILTGGEALSPRHVRLAQRLLGNSVQLINGYGPTECTTFACCYRIPVLDQGSDAPIPIGRPIANTAAYVLDLQGSQAAVGTTGELYLGGPGVARGYLSRPHLTAERFLADRFSIEPEARMYRTGDLVRWRADGELEFLGRADDQVKLRGFRIELGEIETALHRLPESGIRQAVVTVFEPKPANKMLVAYLVGGEGVEDETIRRELAQSLPSYMIPTLFMRLDSFPLTVNGKVDRRALPAPVLTRDATTRFEAPRSELEQSLARIWRELLSLDQVGIHDHFFRLGGNSLTAARVVARVHDLGYQIPVRLVFEHPTIAGLAEAIVGRGNKFQVENPAQRTIPRLPPARESLASYAQQRLWFLDQLEGPGLSAYNISTATLLEGKLSVEALRLGLADLVYRHEPLRTTFAFRDGHLMQVVHDRYTIDLPVVDLREQVKAEGVALTAAGELSGCVRLFAVDEAELPFDLATGPVLRARLLRTAEDEHVLLLKVHHIATDGWSMGVLWRELGEAYRARLLGTVARYPQLPVRYTDYAAWQRQVLADVEFVSSLVYWKQRLAGLEDLELPTDRARPAVLSYRGDRVDFTLSADITERLHALCEAVGVTRHMALLATFQLLLGWWTGREDLAVGVPQAGRQRPELEGLIGFFVNTLVMRADMSGSPSFLEFLTRTRMASLDAQEHSEVPFERLVEELHPERQRNRYPLVQVLFQYFDFLVPDFSESGLCTRALLVPSHSAPVDLEMIMSHTGGHLNASLNYSTDLFDRDSISRLLERFEQVLSQVLDDPDQPITRLSFLLELERAQIESWNKTDAEFPASQPLQALFLKQVQQTPQGRAVGFQRDWWTYEELNGHAERLAGLLSTLGVGPGVPVGIFLDRSPWMVAAVLGIIKAGGAYVPLDTNFPYDRLKFMIEDADLGIIVTTAEGGSRLSFTTCYLVDPSTATGLNSNSSPPRSVARVLDEDVAYVIYTSGSTGRPKGVPVRHRSVMNLLVCMREILSFGRDETLLSVSSLSFDISVLELLLPLINGSRVVLVDSDVARNPFKLREVFERASITIMQATPSTWRLLREVGWKGDKNLKVLCGGEALTPDLATFLVEHAGAVWNVYGPTETTIWSTAQRVTSDTPSSIIGRPLWNTRAYVLGQHGELVPAGMIGELILGGSGVACGYLNRPELTSERFLPDPYSPEQGARMYRTGDLARWRPDGVLEFLGRADYQVKLHGFRIELGEIEAALASLKEVSQAVVTTHIGRAGETRLVGYLVMHQDINDPEIRTRLAGMLPEYMIPSLFVRLPSFPLTTSGKVDRKLLPAPEMVSDTVHDEKMDLSSHQRALTEIWTALLGLDRVGIHDNFFQLGGHSLLAVRLLSAIHDRLGLDISLAKVFQYPTIAGLAQELEAQIPERTRPVLEVLRAGRHDLPPLVVIQGAFGDIFPGWQRAAQAFPEDRTIYAVRVAGSQPFWDGCDTLEELARGVAKLLIEKDSSQPVHLAGWSFGGFLAYEVARQLAAQRFPVWSVLVFDTGPECLQRLPGQQGRRLFRDLSSMFVNLPAWMGDYSDLLRNRNWWLKMASRARGKLVRSGLPAQRTTPEFLQADEIPTLYRQRGDISYQMLLGYRFGPYAGRVTLFRCRTRWLIHRAYDRFLGWDRYVQGPLRELFIPGPHDGFLSAGYQASHSASIAAELRFSDAACLADWESASIHPASP